MTIPCATVEKIYSFIDIYIYRYKTLNFESLLKSVTKISCFFGANEIDFPFFISEFIDFVKKTVFDSRLEIIDLCRSPSQWCGGSRNWKTFALKRHSFTEMLDFWKKIPICSLSRCRKGLFSQNLNLESLGVGTEKKYCIEYVFKTMNFFKFYSSKCIPDQRNSRQLLRAWRQKWATWFGCSWFEGGDSKYPMAPELCPFPSLQRFLRYFLRFLSLLFHRSFKIFLVINIDYFQYTLKSDFSTSSS